MTTIKLYVSISKKKLIKPHFDNGRRRNVALFGNLRRTVGLTADKLRHSANMHQIYTNVFMFGTYNKQKKINVAIII